MSTSLLNLIDNKLLFKGIVVAELSISSDTKEWLDLICDMVAERDVFNLPMLRNNFYELDQYQVRKSDVKATLDKAEDFFERYGDVLWTGGDVYFYSAEELNSMTINNAPRMMIEDNELFMFQKNSWIKIGTVLNPIMCENFCDYFDGLLSDYLEVCQLYMTEAELYEKETRN